MRVVLTGITKRTSYLINSIYDFEVVNCSLQVARDQPTTYLPVIYRLYRYYYFTGYLQVFNISSQILNV